MNVIELFERIQGKCQRTVSTAFSRRPIKMQNTAPLISFTFDDFPRSALEVGGRILLDHGVFGTYYVALGLLDRDEPVGRICSAENVKDTLAQGHELGCHTYGHCDAWKTDPRSFEEAILDNRRALECILPGAKFTTMSYPINMPRPDTKSRAGRHFSGCRGGGQRINLGVLDTNYLAAFFLEQSVNDSGAIWSMIERNRDEGGWLIFVTHDIANHPTKYGCTPSFFEGVVRRAVESGAKVLPVRKALMEVRGEELCCE